LYIKYIKTIKTISLTIKLKKNIPPAKVKSHISRISCQNFSSIQRLTKWKSLFYQRNANKKIGWRSTLEK